MPLSDEPIIPLEPSPRPAHDPNAGRGRRRRVTRRDMIPNDAVGQAAFVFDLARRAYPSFELFVFSLVCGAILGLGYLLDSQAVLLLGILVAPLMTPWVGFLLSILTGSPRFLFETFMALWFLIALALAVYQFGLLPWKGNSGRPGLVRLGVGLTSLAFAAYVGWGLFNYQSLSLLSGLAPPVHYSYKYANDQQKDHDGPGCPQGLDCFHDFDEALAEIRQRAAGVV